MGFSAKDIRNIAIIGGEGKTTLCEAMLFNAGTIDRMGSVNDGNTVMDYDPIEIQRKLSINLSVASAVWKNVKINILDLPGFIDFEGERNSGLSAALGAVLVVDANGVIPIGAESVIDYCLRLKKPLIVFINGMDKENADYVRTVEALRERYKTKLAPIQIPIMRNGKMQGYINAISERAYEFSPKGQQRVEIPEEYKAQLQTMQEHLMETAAENDDNLLDKYFEDGALGYEDTVHGIRLGIASMNTIPVMAGSALQNKGVINLMYEIVKYFPAAADREAVLATDVENKDKIVKITCEENGPFAAQAFKTVVDPFAGKINYIKIYRGKLKSGMVVYNPRTHEEEKISLIYQLRGKKMDIVQEADPGDIVALGKLNDVNTGDTLCEINTKVAFAPIHFPKPVLTMTIVPEKEGEEDKIYQGLRRIKDEDYTFTVDEGAKGEIRVSGQGDMHLDVISMKLKNKYGVATYLKEPTIEYKETIRVSALAEGKHKKQSGGHGQYGHCKIRFEPTEEEFEFAEEVVGGAVPKQYFPAVEKGLRECMQEGVLAGYPVTGIRAVLYDGSYHDVDSSEAAFKAAATLAFKDGMKNARPALLEPIMTLKVRIADEYFGNVMSDIIKRRGRILGTDMVEGKTVLTAEVPKSEILRYATDLRAITQGKGKFVADFVRYEEVPDHIAQKIINK